MAIFDPPDGTTDPRPRCTGHCCRGFSLEKSYAEVVAEAQKVAQDKNYISPIPDVKMIHQMLIPLGVFRGQELFTCKNLGKNGDCQTYETRPAMCRNFPGKDPCQYRNCASHGPQPMWKKIFHWFQE